MLESKRLFFNGSLPLQFVEVFVEFDKSKKESDDERSRLVNEVLLYLDMLKPASNMLAVPFSLMKRQYTSKEALMV